MVNLERVGFNLRNFDMIFIWKDLNREVARIDSIPSQSLETIKVRPRPRFPCCLMPLPCSHLIVHALPPRRLAGLADLDRDQVLRVQGQLELEEHHQVHQGGESCSHRSSVHAARNLLSLMLAPLLCRTPRASWRAAAGTSSTLIRATRRTTPSPSRSSSRGTLALIHALRTRSDATHRSPLAHRSASTSLPCSGSDDGESEDEESSEDESLVESDDDSEYGGEDEEEDEGLDWDELEAEAKADDKKREASDGEEDARARTKPRR